MFLGLPFREVSRSVITGANEARLMQAWNSRPFFAWSERTFFRTPYTHGDIRVTPASFEVKDVLRAEMRGEREPLSVRHEEQTWKVHVERGFFYARLSGVTKRYPVLASDVVEIPDFTAAEWLVREDATHGKSRTYRR